MSTPICEKHGCEKTWVKNKTKKAGGQWTCPECQREARFKYRLRHPERKAASERKWRQANPTKKSAINTKWNKANPECLRANEHRWRKANRETKRAIVERRRASKLNAIVSDRPVTPAMEAERKNLFGGCCYCGSQRKLSLEHVVALTDGGLHVEENLLGACHSCNSSKGSRPVEMWYRSQSFFSEQRWQEITFACSLPSSSCAA